MPTLYVSNAATNGFAIGSGTATYAQMQSKSTPGLTLGEVFGNASLAAGDVIIMNTGDYPENMGSSGALQLTKNFVSNPITIKSYTGNPADVTIRGSGGQTYSIRVWQTSAGGYTFRDVTFTTTAGASPAMTTVLNISGFFNGLKCYNCIIRPAFEQGVDAYGFLSGASSTAGQNILFEDCLIDVLHTAAGALLRPGATNAHAIQLMPSANAGATLATFKIINSKIKSAGRGVNVDSCADTVIENCEIIAMHQPGQSSSFYAPAVLIGVDSTTTAPSANAYTGCIVRGNRIFLYSPDNRQQHGVVSGKGADGAIWQDNVIFLHGTTYSAVVKGDNVKWYNNLTVCQSNRAESITSDYPFGFYPKGSQNLDCRESMFLTYGRGFAMHAGNNTSDSGAYANKQPTGCTFTECFFGGAAGAEVLIWEGGTSPTMSRCTYGGSLTDTQISSGAVPSSTVLGTVLNGTGISLATIPAGVATPNTQEMRAGGAFPTVQTMTLKNEVINAWRTRRIQNATPTNLEEPFDRALVQASPTPSTTAFAGDSALSSSDTAYYGSVVFLTGANAGISRRVQSYVGSTRLITCAAFPAAPASGDLFALIA